MHPPRKLMVTEAEQSNLIRADANWGKFMMAADNRGRLMVAEANWGKCVVVEA